MVEFGLVLPIMLVMLLAVADFGRLMAVGITLNSTARDGAEAAAQQYVQLWRSSTLSSSDLYATVDEKATSVACEEAAKLLGVTTSTSTDARGNSFTTCNDVAVASCVHDLGIAYNANPQPGDPNCAAPPPPAGGDPTNLQANCSAIWEQPWTNAPDATNLPFVEVRVCYRFDTLFQTNLLPVGSIYLQPSADFVAATY